MELEDLADCFEWLKDSNTANRFRAVGNRELGLAGLTLEGWVGAALWANQGRFDRAEEILDGSRFEERRKAYDGLRPLAKNQSIRGFEKLVGPEWPLYTRATSLQAPLERFQAVQEFEKRIAAVTSGSERSVMRRWVAIEYLRNERVRYALDLVEECNSPDRMEVYSQVLLLISGRSN